MLSDLKHSSSFLLLSSSFVIMNFTGGTPAEGFRMKRGFFEGAGDVIVVCYME